MFTSSKKRLFNGQPRRGEAIIISFFGGDPYYGRCAQRLAEDCDRFELAYDIYEFHPATTDTWINICRQKIQFYTNKLREYQAPVMWVDIDTQIVSDPRRILGSTADVGAFLRNFGYLVGFDPMQHARLLHPGYLLFNPSPRTLAFMDELQALDRTLDPAGTDDFVLEEAFRRHPGQLSLQLFSPADIAFSNESERRVSAVFQHGNSGNVKANVAVAVQHDAAILTNDRQKRVLLVAADAHLKAGKVKEAIPFLRRVLTLEPDDASSLIKLLKAYRKLGWEKKFNELVATAKEHPQVLLKVLRYKYEVAGSGGKFSRSGELADRILREGGDEDRAFVQSRQYRFGFDEDAKRRGIADDDRVALWWFERPFPGNLGDMINPYIVEGLTGIPPKYSPRSPRVLAIGSIIKLARKGDRVWGSGCPAADQAIDPGAIFHAVRGPLTRRLVVEAGGTCDPVYGDPAWLLPLIYPDRNLAKTHKVGLIRHYTHRSQPISLDDDVREIEIIRDGKAGIEAFLDELLACEAIVSSSLHGVIIANAYGIPARWATFTASDRQVHGDGMKFIDYFLSVGRTDIEALDLSGIDRLGGRIAAACADDPAHGIDLGALLEAAPFAVSATVLARHRQPPRLGKTARLLQTLGIRVA